MTSSNDRGVIILGSPRSGTTLMRRLIDAHPSIACPGETFLLTACARFLESQQVGHGLDYGVLGGLLANGYGEEEVLSRLRDIFLHFHEDYATRQGKQRWAEKTAIDSFYIDQVERLFGDQAYFICMVRHGFDVVCSFEDWCQEMEIMIPEVHAYVRRYPRLLDAYAHAWVDLANNLWNFAQRHPENAIVCRYEDLVQDPEATMKGVIEFIGETWHPRLLRSAMRIGEAVGIGDSKTYERKEIDAASVERWATLPGNVINRVGGILNPTLELWGYDPIEAAAEVSEEDAARAYELAMYYRAMKSGVESK